MACGAHGNQVAGNVLTIPVSMMRVPSRRPQPVCTASTMATHCHLTFTATACAVVDFLAYFLRYCHSTFVLWAYGPVVLQLPSGEAGSSTLGAVTPSRFIKPLAHLGDTSPQSPPSQAGGGQSVTAHHSPHRTSLGRDTMRALLLGHNYTASVVQSARPWRSPKSGHTLSLQNRP